MQIAWIQTNIHWENITANLALFDAKLASIREPCQLIVLPEMFSTGFSMRAPELAETMQGSAMQWLATKAIEKNAIITGSLMLRDTGNNFFNRVVWMKPDGTYHLYDKRHLFSLADEPSIFTAGNTHLLQSIDGWNVAVQVCYDLRFPVWARHTATYNYDLLIYVANWPERRGLAWKTLLQARAIENQSYVLGVNRVGNDGNNIYHSGDSMLIDPLGEIQSHTVHEEVVLTATLDKNRLQQIRQQLPFLKDADAFQFTRK